MLGNCYVVWLVRRGSLGWELGWEGRLVFACRGGQGREFGLALITWKDHSRGSFWTWCRIRIDFCISLLNSKPSSWYRLGEMLNSLQVCLKGLTLPLYLSEVISYLLSHPSAAIKIFPSLGSRKEWILKNKSWSSNVLLHIAQRSCAVVLPRPSSSQNVAVPPGGNSSRIVHTQIFLRSRTCFYALLHIALDMRRHCNSKGCGRGRGLYSWDAGVWLDTHTHDSCPKFFLFWMGCGISCMWNI